MFLTIEGRGDVLAEGEAVTNGVIVAAGVADIDGSKDGLAEGVASAGSTVIGLEEGVSEGIGVEDDSGLGIADSVDKGVDELSSSVRIKAGVAKWTKLIVSINKKAIILFINYGSIKHKDGIIAYIFYHVKL
ncbi:MAG: hypothetical protein HYS80_02615 [Candidatus Aenigmarchaeota archaeon]|nr:hypothetical protein [Candidatus Aenigmarchaeota archaeon]